MGMRGATVAGSKSESSGQPQLPATSQVNLDMAKLLEQQQQRLQQQQQQQRQLTPGSLPRSMGPGSNPYSVSPLPGRMPIQSGMMPPPVNVPPNPLLVQQLMQGGVNPAARGNSK